MKDIYILKFLINIAMLLGGFPEKLMHILTSSSHELQ